MQECTTGARVRFWLGVLFLLSNSPFGWASLALGASLAAIFDASGLLWLGVVGYGVSWVMLGAGLVLAGPAGIRLSKKVVVTVFRFVFRSGDALVRQSTS